MKKGYGCNFACKYAEWDRRIDRRVMGIISRWVGCGQDKMKDWGRVKEHREKKARINGFDVHSHLCAQSHVLYELCSCLPKLMPVCVGSSRFWNYLEANWCWRKYKVWLTFQIWVQVCSGLKYSQSHHPDQTNSNTSVVRNIKVQFLTLVQ